MDASTLWVVILAVAVVYGLPYMMLLMVQRSLTRMKPVADDDGRFGREVRLVGRFAPWAADQGFDRVGCYTTGAAFIGAWRHSEKPRFFCVYLMQGRCAFDLVTIFSDRVSVTTGSSRDGQLYPRRPGSYLQTFSMDEVESLWPLHLEAEDYLTRHGGIRMEPLRATFEDVFVDACRKELAHARTYFLWQLRVWYWFVVRRLRRHGLSIQRQHESGLIEVPPPIEL